jgi:serine/threonine protein kinase
LGVQFGIDLHRLLVKLSEASDRLPSSLFIRGVNTISQPPLAGGAWADVYQAKYKEGLVVLKSLRLHVVSGSLTAQQVRHSIAVSKPPLYSHSTPQRFCREVLVWTRLKHPYVLPFFGIDNVSIVGGLCMVSPLMQRGTLSRYVQERGTSNLNRFVRAMTSVNRPC